MAAWARDDDPTQIQCRATVCDTETTPDRRLQLAGMAVVEKTGMSRRVLTPRCRLSADTTPRAMARHGNDGSETHRGSLPGIARGMTWTAWP